ncbi:HAD family hydrolase [Micromonospora sp. CA-248089]|uniref:HAD family hydrolase n=1 Tax=unclassified Micromonospora TaxID=2617518 RepID=UPI003D8E31C1
MTRRWRRSCTRHAEAIEPYADTVATLSALRDSGVRIGVVSNVGRDIRKCFARHGLDGYVDAFVLSYEVGLVKPDPRIWGVALEALHAAPGQTLMADDHPTFPVLVHAAEPRRHARDACR